MNKIDTFDILKMSMKPTRAMAQWLRAFRAGVPGVALWNTGSRAEPVELETHHPFLTLTLAQQAYRAYTTLTAADPVVVEFAGFSEPLTRYKVLHVEPIPGQVRALLRGHFAGQDANYRAWLCCKWVLQPVTI